MYDPLGKWLAEEFMLVGLTHKGAFLVILDLLEIDLQGSLWWFWSVGEIFSICNSRWSWLTFRTYREVLDDLNSLGEKSSLGDSLRSWLMVLTYEGVSFVISNPLGSVLGILTC